MALGGITNIIMDATFLELCNSIKSFTTRSGYNLTKEANINPMIHINNLTEKEFVSL